LTVSNRFEDAPIGISAAIVLGALILSWVAIYNGFPLLFWDSGAYIGLAVDNGFWWPRSRSYSEFILMLHQERSLWPVIFVQALIVSHLIYLTTRVVLGRVHAVALLILIAGLSVFSTVAWTVAWIMPDIFTPIVVLGLFLLGFATNRMSRVEAVYIFCLTAVAIHFHNSHVPLALGLLITIVLTRLFLDRGDQRGLLGSTALLAGTILLAISASLFVNFIALGRVTLTPNSHFLLLGRWVDDGPAVEYLKDTCPDRDYALCDYLDDLPMKEYIFLWKDYGPVYQAGGFDALSEEAQEIVYGTLRAYPGSVALGALRNTSVQFLDFQIGYELLPYAEMTGLSDLIIRVFPDHEEALAAARQDAGTLPVQTTRLIHGWAVGLSGLALLPLFYLEFRRRQRMWLGLAITTVSALLGNAFITGAMSKIESRYQSRLIWVLVLVVVLGLASWLSHRAQSTESASTAEDGSEDIQPA